MALFRDRGGICHGMADAPVTWLDGCVDQQY
jgi:hypothetical protein